TPIPGRASELLNLVFEGTFNRLVTGSASVCKPSCCALFKLAVVALIRHGTRFSDSRTRVAPETSPLPALAQWKVVAMRAHTNQDIPVEREPPDRKTQNNEPCSS